MGRVRVELRERSYRITVGDGIWSKQLPRYAKTAARNGRVFVLIDANVFALYGPKVVASLAADGIEAIEFAVPSGEQAKSEGVLQEIYGFLLQNEVSRSDGIVAVGGGVTTDLAGYVAATILRGIRWGAVPTTLLGMVDAAIGGKTGINHRLGKNLIGAFWQPSFVLCDTDFLHTLPRREMIAGLGEVAKSAGLAGGAFVERFEEYLGGDELLDQGRLGRLVEMSAAYKADIVSRDEREGELRMVLNLGHTFGHAIERTVGYGRLLHGEAVLLGLDAAIEASVGMKRSRRAKLEGYQLLVRRLIEALPKRGIKTEEVMAAMGVDKKRAGKKLRFVLLESPGRPIISDTVPEGVIREAVDAMRGYYESKGVQDAKNPRGQRA